MPKSNLSSPFLSRWQNSRWLSLFAPKFAAFSEWPWIVITLAISLMRLHVAVSVPLLGAEAYYWNWGQHLAWGYYDHPPMIAWLIRSTCVLFGKTVFGVRFSPLILGMALPIIVRWFAGNLYGAVAGRIAALIVATTPLVLVGGVLSTPDVVVSFLYLLALGLGLQSARSWSAGKFFLTGVVIAFAILSKFNGFVLVPIFGLYWIIIALDRPGRAQWLPFIGLCGLLILIPYLIWNAAHDWVTFRYLFWYRHKEAGQVLINWTGPFTLLGNFFTLGPILGLLMLAAMYQCIRFSGERKSKEQKLAELTMFLLPLAGFLLLSFKISLAPHWVGQILLTGVVVTVGTLCQWRASPSITSWGPGHRFLLFSASINMIICLLLYGSVLNIAAVYRLSSAVGMPLPYEKAIEFFGWNKFAQQLNKELQETEEKGKPIFILAPDHRLASLALFYASGAPYAAVLGQSKQRQFTFWPKPAEMPHSNAVYVDKKIRPTWMHRLYKEYNSVGPYKMSSVKIFDGYNRWFFFCQLRDRKDHRFIPKLIRFLHISIKGFC